MKQKLAAMCAFLWLTATSLFAQMTFTLNGVDYSSVANRDSKGFPPAQTSADSSPLLRSMALPSTPH